MKKEEYSKIVNRLTPKPNYLKNTLYAFLSGASLGAVCEIIRLILITELSFSNKSACMWIGLLLIIVSCLLTVLHLFDHLALKYQAGIIVPTTGFAHSVCSAILDNKKDGLVTGMGSNTFKLAGTVILYGVVSAFILVIVRVMFNV